LLCDDIVWYRYVVDRLIFQVGQGAVYLMLAEKEIWMMCMMLIIRRRRRPMSMTFKTASVEMKNLLKIF